MPKREWKPDWKRRTADKPQRGARPQRASAEHAGDPDGPVIIYGWHPVKAALENPARGIRRLLATENAVRRLAEDHVPLRVEPELVRPQTIAQRLDSTGSLLRAVVPAAKYLPHFCTRPKYLLRLGQVDLLLQLPAPATRGQVCCTPSTSTTRQSGRDVRR